MTVKTDYLEISTKGGRDVVDITPEISTIIQKHGVTRGVAVVFVPGSTAALTTIEYEPGLVEDIARFLERILPYGDRYSHHDTWHDDNGAAHLQSALIGPSLSIPVVDGRPVLGTWQQVVLIDCDTRPRTRRLVVQLLW